MVFTGSLAVVGRKMALKDVYFLSLEPVIMLLYITKRTFTCNYMTALEMERLPWITWAVSL